MLAWPVTKNCDCATLMQAERRQDRIDFAAAAQAIDLEKLLVWTCGVILVAIVSVSAKLVEAAAGVEISDDFIPTEDDEERKGPVAQLSPALADLVQKMMEREPGRRIGLQDVAAHPWCAAGQAAAGAAQVRHTRGGLRLAFCLWGCRCRTLQAGCQYVLLMVMVFL